MQWEKIIFAGFNALTKAEEAIIDNLIASGKAEMLWDADAYYMEDEKQEAGFFLRKWKRKWKNQPFNWIEKDFAASQQRSILSEFLYMWDRPSSAVNY